LQRRCFVAGSGQLLLKLFDRSFVAKDVGRDLLYDGIHHGVSSNSSSSSSSFGGTKSGTLSSFAFSLGGVSLDEHFTDGLTHLLSCRFITNVVPLLLLAIETNKQSTSIMIVLINWNGHYAGAVRVTRQRMMTTAGDDHIAVAASIVVVVAVGAAAAAAAVVVVGRMMMVSPLTRQPFDNKTLYPNLHIRREVLEYKKDRYTYAPSC